VAGQYRDHAPTGNRHADSSDVSGNAEQQQDDTDDESVGMYVQPEA
jgi:hypothetical protein